MPVLYGGRAVHLAGLREHLTARGIAIVEDAAHAFGSDTGPHRVGATGDLTCFSFDAIKALTCGDGGAVIPRTPGEAATLRRTRALGITSSRIQRGQTVSYTVDGAGFRYHLSTLHAAIGRAQLARFPEMDLRRRALWSTYAAALDGIEDISLVDLDIAHTVPFNCTILVPAPLRDEVHTRLRAAEIAVGVHYPLNHLQPAFTQWADPLPRSEALWRQILTLPFHPDMTDNDVHTVASALRRALRLAADSPQSGPTALDQERDHRPRPADASR
ncbi:DegT/DnrJ/EryC1/StrS family aminotransferase [Amycolatopsis orientalis]|uniref:DegT/DnrJ/EryC1/StrS family aminotransferase n=1 Tax=Amycolatopsis orientalis TaxID=31958 RepID=UPI0004042E13